MEINFKKSKILFNSFSKNLFDFCINYYNLNEKVKDFFADNAE